MRRQRELALERRAFLERRANAIRSRLLRRIDTLDLRRKHVAELGHHAKRIAVPMAAALLGVAAVAVGATFAIVTALRVRRERRLGYRASRMMSALRGELHAEKRPSLLEEAARRVFMTILGILASVLAKRSVVRVIDGRVPLELPR